jgi:hypothetical protein
MPLNTRTFCSIAPETTPERVRTCGWLTDDAGSTITVESIPSKAIKQLVCTKNKFDFKVPPDPLSGFI